MDIKNHSIKFTDDYNESISLPKYQSVGLLFGAVLFISVAMTSWLKFETNVMAQYRGQGEFLVNDNSSKVCWLTRRSSAFFSFNEGQAIQNKIEECTIKNPGQAVFKIRDYPSLDEGDSFEIRFITQSSPYSLYTLN